MVRTTIACAPCRKSKIKCIHEGSPPCQYCLKKGRLQPGQCVLSGPTLSPSRQKSSSQRKRKSAPLVPTSINTLSQSSQDTTLQHETVWRSFDSLEFLFNIDRADILEACTKFNQKFPELRFLHLPTILNAVRGLKGAGDASRESSSKLQLLLTAIVAVHVSMTKGKSTLPTADQIVSKVWLHVALLEPPDLVVVQTLLVLSMFEWGKGNGHKAWMISGMAIRMMQSLLVADPSASQSPAELQSSNRTLWSCFIIDRLVFSGRPQPVTLSYHSLHTFWPSSDEDFVFSQLPCEPVLADSGQGLLENMRGNMAYYYNTLVRGFDIWSRILRFIVSGGRRLPGMHLPANHPWISTSPWKLLYDELQTWRERQEKRMLYPEASIESHAALGQAEPFAYLNLIYYTSLLFLNREYIPFLPKSRSEPSGPIDPPLLSVDPPVKWWHDRAEELFTSAIRISLIMSELDDADAPLCAPFPGFCLFSAATTNLYSLAFPWMHPNRNQNMAELVETDFGLLDKFRKIWHIGEGWWLTVQQCKRLYDHARTNLNGFDQRTRADFSTLESAIHDGQRRDSRHEERLVQGEILMPDGQQMPSHTSNEQGWAGQDAMMSDILLHNNWDGNQLWPLWGQQHDDFFAFEEFPAGIS
ncbi:fungal-specific transcription factor domain-containing protein [Pyrenochaeta sp. MPI-SDFR-AT-0127]|nr:fungal-specific transcription factor domain-containing protein [Pyrenochaeta sp. MPI-SDFR-AT-0127]